MHTLFLGADGFLLEGLEFSFFKVLCLGDGEVSPHLTDLIKW